MALASNKSAFFDDVQNQPANPHTIFYLARAVNLFTANSLQRGLSEYVKLQQQEGAAASEANSLSTWSVFD